jgi:hypothetical protein
MSKTKKKHQKGRQTKSGGFYVRQVTRKVEGRRKKISYLIGRK